MLIRFFFQLRAAGIRVTVKEFLGLLEALEARIATLSVDDFYWLARTCLVKDERLYDRYDRVFAAHFHGLEQLFAELDLAVPDEWLRALGERVLTEEEKSMIASLGGWDALMQALRERLSEQASRHEGGNRWIGTAGTSPYGAQGYHPEGIRIGQAASRQRRAVKIWERREFANLDDAVELGTRNMKLALRKLRRFAREGAAEELDLDATIAATARNAGYLDLRLVPERHNAVKVLLFLDVGGSMEEHVHTCEELFSAARSEFRHLEHFYFHNFLYETVWKDNRRRHGERIETWRLLRTYSAEYRVIFVGDASMSPYEILQPGGSIEHWNAEAGRTWMERMTAHFPRLAWLNPVAADRWAYTASIRLVRELLAERMFPLTLAGLDRAMTTLKRREAPAGAAAPLAAGPGMDPG
jgi:uncharacterized protein